jgi:hypothetical protein
VRKEWLPELVAAGKVSYATQKQALNALVFLYRDVCGMVAYSSCAARDVLPQGFNNCEE